MIVANNDSHNATLVFEGLELKALALIITKMNDQQAMEVAAELHDAGFNQDEQDVKAYARTFKNITHYLCEAINARRCPGCGEIHDEEEEDSTPPTVN